MRTVMLSFRSTAENLAKYFFEELSVHIPAVYSVRVWETAESFAEYKK
jgi:6-pyruvoyl-tetrahydropterin synthase